MKKSLIHIMIANIFYLLLVAGNNFILPKFLSIETYAAVKEYTLYLTTYANILTFGYINGVYLEYGGKEVEKIDPADVGKGILSFIILILPICVAVTIWGVISKNIVILVLGAGIMSTNLSSYYQMFYQATGDFKAYGLALNSSRVLMLFMNLIFIFLFKTDSALFYVGISPVIGICVAVYLTFKLNKKLPIIKYMKFDWSTAQKNIKGGFILMLGDFVTKFFSSIDRWFVKGLLETFSFAMYSFAVSMENLVNTFMTPITVSMYNYFCKNPNEQDIRRMKDNTLIYSFIVIAGAYPCKWIMETFMVKYISANSVLFPLFAAQGLSAIIKGIYVNKYKAEGNQKKYLYQMIAMLVLAIISNVVFYYFWSTMTAFAVATLLTNIIWLIWCEIDDKGLRYNYASIISIIILLIVYLWTGYKFNSIVGCIIYCLTGLVLGFTLLRKSFVPLCRSLFSSFLKKLIPQK